MRILCYTLWFHALGMVISLTHIDAIDPVGLFSFSFVLFCALKDLLSVNSKDSFK